MNCNLQLKAVMTWATLISNQYKLRYVKTQSLTETELSNDGDEVNRDRDIISGIVEKFETALIQYGDMETIRTPIIPKQKPSIRLAKIRHVLDSEIWLAHFTQVYSIEDLAP
ncbi:hypothetical protein WA026_012313 [Henosepilachna vigintioctopunctata]|uniref:Uncharacterized protein n=1 Tax=Henosepilachna vigintioctopunctata TaxID=420089 RepID=A0AAW1V032_9CUCU